MNDNTVYGKRLRLAREAKGLSLETVAEKLRLKCHVVRALEQDVQDQMPAPAFVRGYIRAYSQLVSENADELVELYNKHAEKDPLLLPAVRVESSQQDNGVMLRWGTVTVVVVLLLLTVIWLHDYLQAQHDEVTTLLDFDIAPAEPNDSLPVFDDVTSIAELETSDLLITGSLAASKSNESQAATDAESSKIPKVPVNELKSGSAAEAGNQLLVSAIERTLSNSESELPKENEINLVAPRGSDRLQLSFLGKSWLEAVDANGYRLVFGMFDESDNGLSVRGQAPFQIIVGDANQVKLKINDSEYELESYIRSNNTARVLLGNGSHNVE